MMQSSPATERLRSFLVIAATGGTLAFNFLAGTGRLSGISTGEVAARFTTMVTPASYAFSIWSLIYLGLAAFSIWQALPRNIERFAQVRSLYIFSCALNCAWLYFWQGGQIFICAAILFALAITLFFINFQLRKHTSTSEYWAARAPFSIYFGWTTAAALVNLAVALRYSNIVVSESSQMMLAVCLILLAAALAVVIRRVLADYLYPLAVAWALTAIAVEQSGKTFIVSAAAAGVVACLIASASFVMNAAATGRDR